MNIQKRKFNIVSIEYQGEVFFIIREYKKNLFGKQTSHIVYRQLFNGSTFEPCFYFPTEAKAKEYLQEFSNTPKLEVVGDSIEIDQIPIN
jgi:hypothetical protein